MPDPSTPGGTDLSSAAGSDALNTPTTGHFLPGGAGDKLAEDGLAMAGRGVSRQPLEMGKAREMTANPSLQRRARPLTTEPNTESFSGYSGPPPAPLPHPPYIPLKGTRRPGGARRIGWQSSAARPGLSQFSATDTADLNQPMSKVLIVSLAVILVAVLTGGGIAGFRVMDSWGDTVDNPVARPSAHKPEVPLLTPPPPTVTKTVQPVPDLVRLRQNQLYKVGPVAASGCTEPKVKPDSQITMLRYYQALLPCLNRAWGPVVKKAGYEFRPPKLVLHAKGATPCTDGDEDDRAYYCPASETIAMQTKLELKDFRRYPEELRIDLMSTVAHEYAHHVQYLTHIITANHSREGWSRTKAEELEWSRRLELQAECLAAVHLGANKKTFKFEGERYRDWVYQEKHRGDEYDPKKVRDHGSRKNVWLWANAGFTTTNPAACNTYVAPPAKVS